MTQLYGLATPWLGLALLATLLSIWLWIATAMSEIIVGTVAQLIIGAALGAAALGSMTAGSGRVAKGRCHHRTGIEVQKKQPAPCAQV